MSLTNFRLIKECLIAADREETLRDYSGRGMYGRQCAGITCSNPYGLISDLFAALIEVSADGELEENLAQLAEIMSGSEHDSMGRDSIIYWPSVEFEDDDTPLGQEVATYLHDNNIGCVIGATANHEQETIMLITDNAVTLPGLEDFNEFMIDEFGYDVECLPHHGDVQNSDPADIMDGYSSDNVEVIYVQS